MLSFVIFSTFTIFKKCFIILRFQQVKIKIQVLTWAHPTLKKMSFFIKKSRSKYALRTHEKMSRKCLIATPVQTYTPNNPFSQHWRTSHDEPHPTFTRPTASSPKTPRPASPYGKLCPAIAGLSLSRCAPRRLPWRPRVRSQSRNTDLTPGSRR